jgi:hypothetical protein
MKTNIVSRSANRSLQSLTEPRPKGAVLSRRQLTVAVMASAAAQAMPQTPAAPEDDLKIARDRMKATIDALAKQAVPMATEPAFTFKA